MRTPRVADFRDRIVLCRFATTVDSELNRIETIEPVRTTWACVTAKTSNVDPTSTGTRPEIQYEILIRKQAVTFDCIQWNGRTLRLTEPWYPIENKYILIRAVDIVG